MSSRSEPSKSWPADDFGTTEELVRRQGVKPIASVDELVHNDPFESDEEYAEFLADLYTSRSSGLS